MKWRTVCVLRRRICLGFPFASSTWNASVHASSTVYFPVILNSQFSSEHWNPEHEQNASCISLISPGSGSKFSPSGVVPVLSTCNTSAHASGTGYLLVVFNSQFCSECQDPKHEKDADCFNSFASRQTLSCFSTEIYFQFQNKTELTYRDWLKSQTCVSLFYPCSEIHPPPHFVRQKSRWIWRWTTIRYVKLHD